MPPTLSTSLHGGDDGLDLRAKKKLVFAVYDEYERLAEPLRSKRFAPKAVRIAVQTLVVWVRLL
jgi:hypothetical protein